MNQVMIDATYHISNAPLFSGDAGYCNASCRTAARPIPCHQKRQPTYPIDGVKILALFAPVTTPMRVYVDILEIGTDEARR
jgi:hypothetical protein